MSNGIDMEKARRETNRWLILQCLNVARPIGANDTLINSALSESASMTHQELQRELDYLEGRQLVELKKAPGTMPWHAKLTRIGIDLVEYTVQCEPGIARPEKYW